MLPDGEGVSTHDAHDADNVDPYVVSLVTAARESKAEKHSEAIRVVEDELLGSSTRRRAQLLNSTR